MSQVEDTTGETHTIVWRIKNCSYCTLEAGSKLESMASTAGNLYKTEWRLRTYPKGKPKYPDYLGLFLKRDDGETVGPETIHVEFELSLVTCDGVQIFKRIRSEKFRRGDSIGFSKFAKLEDILCRKEFLLQSDTLTVHCKIRRLNPKWKPTSRQVFITQIPIEKTSIRLILENFRSIRKENPKVVSFRGSKNLLSLRVSINKSESSKKIVGRDEILEHLMEPYLHIVMVKEKSEDSVKVSCTFKLLNDIKEVALKKSFSHLFSKLEEEWILPYFLDTNRLDERCIEDGNRLNFDVEFTVCDGPARSSQMAALTPLNALPNRKETTLVEDLNNMRKNKKFSDVILRIGDDAFPAHKFFLAVRSPRFEEIFTDLERNTTGSENQVGEVEITDVDQKTMELMLQFIYTDKLEDIDDQSCLSLYSASQIYQIPSLRFKCASILRRNLSVKQIHKALLIAEQSGDSELKMIAFNFILEHHDQVLAAPEWEEFAEEYKELANQILRHVEIKMQQKHQE